jgi:hypothetical protein
VILLETWIYTDSFWKFLFKYFEGFSSGFSAYFSIIVKVNRSFCNLAADIAGWQFFAGSGKMPNPQEFYRRLQMSYKLQSKNQAARDFHF